MPLKQYDTLGRRNPFVRVPTGKRVTPHAADIYRSEKLHSHPDLPSNYLVEYSIPEYNSHPKSATSRFTDMFHETNTPDRGAYWDRPMQQTKTVSPWSNNLVYRNGEPMDRRLKALGKWSEYAPKPFAGPEWRKDVAWLHDFGCSCITASLELGALRKSEDVEYIPGHALLERAQTPLVFDTRVHGQRMELKPDRLFAFQYRRPDASYYRVFLVEFDRGTEPIKGVFSDRKSHERNVLQYKSVIPNRAYKEKLKINASLMVLYVTVNEMRMRHMMAVTDNNYSAFANVNAFGDFYESPDILYHLFTGPWLRCNREPVYLNTLDGKPPHGSV